MSALTPPLRFLTAVIGSWAAVRAAMLAPLWPGTSERTQTTTPAAALRVTGAVATEARLTLPRRHEPRLPPVEAAFLPARASMPRPDPPLPFPGLKPAGPEAPRKLGPPASRAAELAPPSAGLAGRWSASAWAFVRHGRPAPLASVATLGGSQIGARLSYRLNGSAARPLSLSVRLSSPVGRVAGAEAALGLEWQPVRRLPLRLLAERRQALGSEGRSAFALLVHGGVHDEPVAAGFRLDAYAQAGIVGAGHRDLFADGGVRLSLPVDEAGRVRLGAGAWAAAQPGVARLDAGPHLSLRLPGVTLALDWRVRLAGDAAPRSGPAATLSTDF